MRIKLPGILILLLIAAAVYFLVLKPGGKAKRSERAHV